ncbi:hypothetical protein Hanom_Chr08g00699241 [Helianthus anomalus]
MGIGTKYTRYGPVRYRYMRVNTGTENVKSRYRKGTRFGKFSTGTGSILLVPN